MTWRAAFQIARLAAIGVPWATRRVIEITWDGDTLTGLVTSRGGTRHWLCRRAGYGYTHSNGGAT